jgi:2-polyprenyl-6-methoxyphenol hydroxylase-like FAD-dependent oxidoreductase
MGHVVVVGAGPAGGALGYLLARRGIDVTVLERAVDFDREFRGEGLMPSGIDAFAQMGLGPDLDALPHSRLSVAELYRGGRRLVRFEIPSDGDDPPTVRFISQKLVLEMLAERAGRFPSYRLERGALVHDVLREGGRVVGVSYRSQEVETKEVRADLVVGADGRGSALRRASGLRATVRPQSFDVVWVKVPLPDSFEGGRVARVYVGRGHFAFLFPSFDGRLQIAWIIDKGTFGELHRRGVEAWVDEMANHVTPDLAEHLRRNRSELAHPFVLSVVSDRLERWWEPGMLLIGDAAHPMSPVGAQGLNVALRDALVAANHLVPALLEDASPEGVDAALQRIQDERMPEIVAIQTIQDRPPVVLFERTWWSPWILRLMPLLFRLGIVQRALGPTLRRIAFGVVPVKLSV